MGGEQLTLHESRGTRREGGKEGEKEGEEGREGEKGERKGGGAIYYKEQCIEGR